MTFNAYYDQLDASRRQAVKTLCNVVSSHLPPGFAQAMNYGMPSFVVPHSLYPAGYHCDPKLPLGFISVASQKNFIALYHMGLYADPELTEWFIAEYPKHSKTKLDMGKSCIRFKKPDLIPYTLIGELAAKITPEQWIALYENRLLRK